MMVKNENLVVYGLGTTGKSIVDFAIFSGCYVSLIIDKNYPEKQYNGIKVVGLDELWGENLSSTIILMGLHNHYIDVGKIKEELLKFSPKKIVSIVNIQKYIPNYSAPSGYWLDFGYSYTQNKENLLRMRSLLHDKTSKNLYDQVIKFRQHGNIEDCPQPSLFDEYTPLDLPRYKEPLRIIDCGAYNGVAIEKFQNAGYAIESFVAFEPDENNFKKLVAKKYKTKDQIFLPLGTWSVTKKFSFEVNSSMSSRLSTEGENIIQCVRVDDVLRGYKANIIKLDVEGAEIETLKGMESIIKESMPNLCISIYHEPQHIYEAAFLINSWNLGYKIHMRLHEHNTFGLVLYCLKN